MGDFGCDDVLESTRAPRQRSTRIGGRRDALPHRLWSRICRFGGPIAMTLIVGFAGGGFVGSLGEGQGEAGRPHAAGPVRAVPPPACRDSDVWKTVDTSTPAVPSVPGGAMIDVQVRARFSDGRLLGLCAWCAVRQDPGVKRPAATLDACVLTPVPAPPRSATPPALNPDGSANRLTRIREAAWTAPAGQAELRASCAHAWQAQAEVASKGGDGKSAVRAVRSAGYQATC